MSGAPAAAGGDGEGGGVAKAAEVKPATAAENGKPEPEEAPTAGKAGGKSELEEAGTSKPKAAAPGDS